VSLAKLSIGQEESPNPLWLQVQGEVNKCLLGLFTDMMDHADDFLFKLTEQAADAFERKKCLTALRTIRVKRGRIEQCFNSALVNSSFVAGAADSLERINSLERMNSLERINSPERKNQLEVALAIKSMVSRATKVYLAAEKNLSLVLNSLPQFCASASEPPKKTQVLSYVGIATAFDKAFQGFSLPIDIRIMLYKMFEQRVLLKLEGTYEHVHGFILKSEGVPKILKQRLATADKGSSECLQVKRIVDGKISHLCGCQNLPVFVAEMLDKVWSKVLFLIALTEGIESELWDDRVKVMDRLILSVSDFALQCEGDEFDRLKSGLEKNLRGGFESIALKRDVQDMFVRVLENRYLMIEKERVELGRSCEDTLVLDADEMEEIILSLPERGLGNERGTEVGDEMDGYFAQVDALQLGVRFELVDGVGDFFASW